MYDRQREVERERIDAEKCKVSLKQQQIIFIKEHQQAKILSLERAYRESEIEIQRRKDHLQKMAEVLSFHCNKIITKTFADFRLNEMHQNEKNQFYNDVLLGGTNTHNNATMPNGINRAETVKNRTFGYKGKTGLEAHNGVWNSGTAYNFGHQRIRENHPRANGVRS